MPACEQAVGCGVCDTPELWCGAAGLCARDARVLVPPNLYIHTYGWTRGWVGRRCGDCDCGARGLRGLGGWMWGIRLQAPRGPALRVRDSVAAAATWLDIARYSDTGGLSQRYTPGGGYTTTTVAPI